MPDADTIRVFRDKPTDAGTLQVLLDAFDHGLQTNDCLAMVEAAAASGYA